MAITYPLNTPTYSGMAGITLSAENSVAVSQSPSSFKQQVVSHPGQRWLASVSLPPMHRDNAEPWISMLVALKGQVGTFLLGDPNGTEPRGSARASQVNQIAYSEELDNAAWIKTNCTVGADYASAPDGSITADFVVANTAVAQHYLQSPNLSLVTGTKYVASICLKAGVQTSCNVSLNGLITSYPLLNLLTGAITGTHVGAYSENAGNGWWRFVFPGTSTITSGSRFVLWPKDLALAAADGTSGVYAWGVQFETGTTVTDYQPIAASYAPAVNGAGQTGSTLNIKLASPSEVGFLLAGDYIQIGTGTSSQLYKVLTDVTTGASGNATLDIWPDLRSSPADGATVKIYDTKGSFRLANRLSQWSIDNASSYGVNFDCVEAL